MTIIPFPAPKPEWASSELTALLGVCDSARSGNAVSGWATGKTEAGDPQLYLLGPAPEQDCVLCISRLGRVYVLEDGSGRLLFEHDSLLALAEQASAALRRSKTAIMSQLAIAWCALREAFEEKVEPALAESAEILAHFAAIA